jgi:hypothetical protein
VPDPNAIYASEQDISIANAPLTAYVFNHNRGVFGMIKQLTLNGAAFSYIVNEINRRKDEREAWLALRQHYEGEAQVNRQKDAASETLCNTVYKGERATYTFESFSAI